jgi:Xaa-Pro aminopeptidase
LKRDNRLNKLRQRLAKKEIEAILISQPENRYYLSGFDGSDGILLITPKNRVLATDFRYIEQAKRQASDCELFEISSSMETWLPGLIGGLNLGSLGFEADHISFATYHHIKAILGKAELQLKLIPIDKLVESLRAIKEPDEIEFITKAAAITDAAFKYVADTIHPGMTERELAWKIEKFLRENGSEQLPFAVIVASGPNSALPHAKPSQRAIKSMEPVLIDIGARFKGYGSDLSRTICLGNPDDTFKRVYEAVLGTQLKTIAEITAGMTGDQADAIARRAVNQAGFGDGFGHGLGHGLGLAPHEQPRLGPNSQDELSDDMVFTTEPGIYLAGWGGVRIEDTVIMENGKIRIISQAKK